MRRRIVLALCGFALASGVASHRALADTVALETEIALLASATVGDALVLPISEKGEAAVAPVLSLLLAKAPPEAARALELPEADRAAILRAQAVLSRLGAPAVSALVGQLESSSGARRSVCARALAAASVRSLEAGDEAVARAGAQVLAGLLLPGKRTVLVAEDLLFSGRTTAPREDDEGLPRALGALAPVALPLVSPLASHQDEETRRLAVRALASSSSRREDAAIALGHLLDQATAPLERARLGRALGEVGGETAVEALERAIVHGPAGEARDRIVDIEATLNPAAAPRVLARSLERLAPSDRARALDAISVVALPPPPPPKARFVVDPFAHRRGRPAREGREAGRQAAIAALCDDRSPCARLAAARTLEALRRPERSQDAQALAARALAALEAEPVLDVKAETARALVELAPEEVLAPRFAKLLAATLDQEAEQLPAAVAAGFGFLTVAPRVPVDAAARDRLAHALLSPLGEDEADLALLSRVVEDGGLSASVRARAAAKIARLGIAGRARLDELRASGDETARSCAAAARAGVLAPEAAGDLLQEAFALGRSPRALSRRAAVDTLAYGAGKNAFGFVIGLARNDPSPDVRLEGTYALARVYGKQAAPQLAQALLDRELSVRRAAARALARLGEPNIANVLVVAIARSRKLADGDQGEAEEREYRAALATLGKDSVPSLAGTARGSGDPLERRIAMAQLGRVATDEAIASLLPLVRDPKVSQDDRDAAARAIERATGRDLSDPMWVAIRGR